MNARYALRRFVLWLGSPGVACTVQQCPENRVGFSVWCREHTDQILQHRHSPELVAALDAWEAP